ncbi:TetR/AcrR family transcriptional regulator, partial [Nonomuraea dietziae]
MRSENEASGQKPRSFIEQARRAQIMASAIEVIAEVGFAKASLALIAKHAGISKGVISYHFAGKDELMEQVVDHVYSGIADFVLARMEGESTATGLLRTHLLTVAEHMRDHRVQLMALGEIFHNLRLPDG